MLHPPHPPPSCNAHDMKLHALICQEQETLTKPQDAARAWRRETCLVTDNDGNVCIIPTSLTSRSNTVQEEFIPNLEVVKGWFKSNHVVGSDFLYNRCMTGSLPFLLESRLMLLGLTAGCSSVSVDILGLQLD